MADPTKTVDTLAKIIWDYMHMGHILQKCDAIFALCCFDTRVAGRAAELFLDGLGEYLIFSGGVGRGTEGKFAKPEADVFADIAVAMGVPADKIIIENKSTSTGHNIRFTYALLQERDLHPKSLILVQTPYMERRTYATFKKQWLNPTTKILVTSPQLSYENYCNDENPKDVLINVMVGDLQRIKEYPSASGFQIEQDIPANVWGAYTQLIKLGYTKDLIPVI